MVELVWDAGRNGTGRADSGASLRVGPDGHFSPEDLLALSAAGCLMRSVLKLAADDGLPLLSYLSTAEVSPDDRHHRRPHVRVHAYLTASCDEDRERLQTLLKDARTHSPITCLLGDRVDVVSDFQVLAGAGKE